MNISDLIKYAKEEADVDVTKAQSYEDFKPQRGEKYLVTPKLARAIKAKTGTPGVSLQLTIVDGPDGVNRTIWVNYYLAQSLHPNVVARTLHYLELLGVSAAVLEAVDWDSLAPGGANGVDIPFEEVIAGMEPAYRKDKNDPTKEWPNHHFTAGASAGKVVSVPADDDDLAWDE